MPEINPLSNDQIFLKKIAENTGSDYDTGDVSEINPLTIDQILLKEIAANTAGQSGDITELEEKVTANAEAIEAMVNANGCCNVLDLSNPSIVSDGVTFTVNSDGSVTANGTAVTKSFIVFKNAVTTRDMVVVGASDGVHIIAQPHGHSWEEVDEGIIHGINQNGFALQVDAGVTVNNETVYPMLYDARLTPTGYVPYAMTNRELTERVNNFEYTHGDIIYLSHLDLWFGYVDANGIEVHLFKDINIAETVTSNQITASMNTNIVMVTVSGTVTLNNVTPYVIKTISGLRLDLQIDTLPPSLYGTPCIFGDTFNITIQ